MNAVQRTSSLLVIAGVWASSRRVSRMTPCFLLTHVHHSRHLSPFCSHSTEEVEACHSRIYPCVPTVLTLPPLFLSPPLPTPPPLCSSPAHSMEEAEASRDRIPEIPQSSLYLPYPAPPTPPPPPLPPPPQFFSSPQHGGGGGPVRPAGHLCVGRVQLHRKPQAADGQVRRKLRVHGYHAARGGGSCGEAGEENSAECQAGVQPGRDTEVRDANRRGEGVEMR